MRWARDLVGVWAVYSVNVGDEVDTRSGGWMGYEQCGCGG